MRNLMLHRLLEAFTVDASGRLCAEAAGGAEMPFELAEERSAGRAPLYCYRPLTGAFIGAHMDLLTTLPSHDPAARALADGPMLDAYLGEHGVKVPPGGDARARAGLQLFLARVFGDRAGFGFEPAHFEAAYAELERALYQGRCTTTVIAPVLGIALDPQTTELELDDGLALVRGDAVPEAPVEAVWGDSHEPHVLAVLTVDEERLERSPVALAGRRFRRLLSALRLFERGAYAIGPVGWARTEAGGWRSVALGAGGRPRTLTLVSAAQEDELRAFCRLLARSAPTPELGWALRRFEMGCERPAAGEALTDHLLALRALLEPEGPASGRMAQRLAAICARPEERGLLAERAAQAIAAERAVIGGLRAAAGAETLVDEISEHLRAILRDALCGHLSPDLCAVADELLAEPEPAPAPARETETAAL